MGALGEHEEASASLSTPRLDMHAADAGLDLAHRKPVKACSGSALSGVEVELLHGRVASGRAGKRFGAQPQVEQDPADRFRLGEAAEHAHPCTTARTAQHIEPEGALDQD